jgi:hypothetical protein
MGAYRDVRRSKVIIVITGACIMAAVGTRGAPNPGGRPPSKPVNAGSAESAADGLALILQRLKVQFATPNSSNEARGPNYARVEEQSVTFELPGGDLAGKSQVMDISIPVAEAYSP